MDRVRIGIVGMGIGRFHAGYLLEGKVQRAELTAVCDIEPRAIEDFKGRLQTFTDSDALIQSGFVDAVIIGTPHYQHTTIGIAALRAGLHVLVEKPISAHKVDGERLVAAHRNRKQVFAVMFQERTSPRFRKIKDLIQNNELGVIRRVNWTVTNWFRTNAYYASSGWRATWAGEGGGVLLNQCPHNLDILTWLFGMPTRVRAFCALGKHHPIEVEDEVTAYFEYANGATGVFVTTTGEAPGTDRLEIAGDRGRLVVEQGRIAFTRNEISAAQFCRESPSSFSVPPVWHVDVPVSAGGGSHMKVTQNFVDAILDGVPLIAPAEEGLLSLELGNAMLFSGLTGKTVELPLDGAAYERLIRKLVASSRRTKTIKKKTGGKKAGNKTTSDIMSSFLK